MGKEGFILTEDIADIRGQVVLPSGSVVTKAVLKKIDASRPTFSAMMLQDHDIFHDFQSLMDEPNYRATIANDDIRKKVLSHLGRVQLPEPVFEELAHMRESSIILYHHTLATTFLATRLVLEYIFYADDVIKVASAALTRDIGMTRLPPSLLKNTDHLSRQEFFRIQRHPMVSLVLLTHYFGDGLNALVGLRHHDGRKRQSNPSKLIELVTMVDVFNALISPRPFRTRAFDVRGALDALGDMVKRDEANVDLVKLLIASYRSGPVQARNIVMSTEKLGYAPTENYYGVTTET